MSASRRVAISALALTALIFLFNLPAFVTSARAGVDLAEMAFVFLWLVAATTFTRTVALSTVLAFWFIGVYAAFIASLAIGQPIAALTGNTTAFAAVVSSVLEEIVKAAPVAAFVLLAGRKGRWPVSASDALLLGYAVGAGFAFHEDAVGRMTSGSGWTATGWSVLFPTLLYQFGRPTLGHDGWTALVGAALGLAVLFRRDPRSRWIPLAALALVVVDHGVANWIGREGRRLPGLVAMANALLLDGNLPIAVLAGAIAGTVLLDTRALRKAARAVPQFPPVRADDLVKLLQPPATVDKLKSLVSGLDYIRARRAVLVGAWTLGALRDPLVSRPADGNAAR